MTAAMPEVAGIPGGRFPWKVPAEREYERDPQLKKEDVAKVQEWITSTPYLPKVDDEMVCQFLHACFYDVEQTKKTMDNFYTYRATMPDFFDNWDPTLNEIQETANNILIAAGLPNPDSNGNRVIVCKLNDTSTEKFIYPACVKWILMCCTLALWERGVEPGYVIVYDATGYTMSHLLKCSLSNVRNYINYGKNASPIRVVKIVFINTSPVVKKLLTLVRPFLNKELINMMAFYTTADEYFSSMPKENIPEDYGGQAPALLSIHRESIKAIMASKDYLKAEERQRADMSKKTGKSNKDSAKLETSFKKLELD